MKDGCNPALLTSIDNLSSDWFGANPRRISSLDFRFVYLDDPMFDGVDFSLVDFANSQIIGGHFSNCRLDEVDFKDTQVNADFVDCTFHNVTFVGSQLSGARFESGDAEWLDVTGAMLCEEEGDCVDVRPGFKGRFFYNATDSKSVPGGLQWLRKDLQPWRCDPFADTLTASGMCDFPAAN